MANENFNDADDLYERPDSLKSGTNGVPAAELSKLNDNQVVPAYKVPWEANGHLSDADDDCYDSVWGIQDGRRNVRQLKTIKEM
jgi:hypothetical protein